MACPFLLLPALFVLAVKMCWILCFLCLFIHHWFHYSFHQPPAFPHRTPKRCLVWWWLWPLGTWLWVHAGGWLNSSRLVPWHPLSFSLWPNEMHVWRLATGKEYIPQQKRTQTCNCILRKTRALALYRTFFWRCLTVVPIFHGTNCQECTVIHYLCNVWSQYMYTQHY